MKTKKAKDLQPDDIVQLHEREHRVFYIEKKHDHPGHENEFLIKVEDLHPFYADPEKKFELFTKRMPFSYIRKKGRLSWEQERLREYTELRLYKKYGLDSEKDEIYTDFASWLIQLIESLISDHQYKVKDIATPLIATIINQTIGRFAYNGTNITAQKIEDIINDLYDNK